MNKRAKKRVKEALEKNNLERDKVRKEQMPFTPQERANRPGFEPAPGKKRG